MKFVSSVVNIFLTIGVIGAFILGQTYPETLLMPLFVFIPLQIILAYGIGLSLWFFLKDK